MSQSRPLDSQLPMAPRVRGGQPAQLVPWALLAPPVQLVQEVPQARRVP
jgi:hypothetical protein